MVNGQKSDMEHKNTNDKNEYHFQLPEVVVKGKMPGWMRRQLGMVLHRNPALFRKCMKNATSLEEEQFYFNLAFNAAREETSQQFVQAALYNPQIEMFARFKMKSSFHKTKRII